MVLFEFNSLRYFQLNSLTVQAGLPNHMLKENLMNQFYNQFPIQRLDFFLNINHAIMFANDYSQIKLKSKIEENG